VSLYLSVKWLHVVSSVLLVGTGFGSACFMFFANRSDSVAARAFVARQVVRADWWFTTPAGIVQPVTGVLLAHWAGWPLSTPWLAVSIGLFVLAGLCWLPVLWLQLRLAEMAEAASSRGCALDPRYADYARWWERLGYPAFAAMLVVFYLMVAKPGLGG
jgi:uncharacterized membrane protein